MQVTISEQSGPVFAFVFKNGDTLTSNMRPFGIEVCGIRGLPGQGVPTGGTAGQVLAKASGEDYDTEWSGPMATRAELSALQSQVDALYPRRTVGPSDVVAVSDAAALNADDMTIGIEPVQDLHGYDNPWPAGGGKNKYPIEIGADQYNTNASGSYVNNNGQLDVTMIASNGSGVYARGVSELLKLTTQLSGEYTYSFYIKSSVNMSVLIGYERFGQKVVSVTGNWTRVSATASFDKTQSSFVVYNRPDSPAGTVSIRNFQIESDSAATPYAPYSNTCPISGWTGANVRRGGAGQSDPILYPISWEDEAGTVYGGTLDITTGVLTVDMVNIASYSGQTLPGVWISSMDAYAQGTTPTTGAQVVYELAAPVTYQLTPTQIAMLLGDNTVWANTGYTTLTYKRDIASIIGSIT